MESHSAQQKERFSRAFIVASSAGADLTCDFVLDDLAGVDVVVKDHLFALDIQLKATASPKINGDHLIFDLDVRTYNLLATTERSGYGVLALVVIHREPDNWVVMSDDSTTLTHCAYYLPLTGLATTENKATKRLKIPLANRLTPDAMGTLMEEARARWSA